jgi:hypothetical protein
MNEITEYIKNTLHINVQCTEYTNSPALPLYLEKGFSLRRLDLPGTSFILAKPSEKRNLTALRNDIRQLEKLTRQPCVLCMHNIRSYTREKMISGAIPFIVPGKQLYLPFLGVSLLDRFERNIQKTDGISFAAQKLLLTAIYEGWREIRLTDAAKAIGYTKVTLMNCFDELQAVGLPLVEKSGKYRMFIWEKDRKSLWDLTYRHFRSPVIRQYMLIDDVSFEQMKLSGISALCRYTMLSETKPIYYAIDRKADKVLCFDQKEHVPVDEIPAAVVQVLHYFIDFPKNESRAIDPLSAILALGENELADPRVQSSIEEITEVYLNGAGNRSF